MIDELWKEFYAKQDWGYHNRSHWPTFEECFKEGIKAGLELKKEIDESLKEKPSDYCEGIE